MTVAGIIAILILAFTNAWAGLDERRFAVNEEDVGYVRRFIKVEAFWRAFVTNLSFGGVSLSLAIIGIKSDWHFWDINNAIVPLLLNFAMGIFAPRELRDEYDPPPLRSKIIVGIGFFVYGIACWSAWTLYK